ncbi:hypothetical protein [Litoreibacter roseus]|uniref:Uncharacterized protein n=1 Tax=Litoreibacter roseus TaxID=2601869 RepID=A0A6N6JJ34_9RHOB|nr:hypothetical protein [Litoreibacter roseus]GFE66341.1 hypothetical protein KIN_34150 [Litoreibacter roseus]
MDGTVISEDDLQETLPERVTSQNPEVRDLRAKKALSGDRSEHRRHTWLYEDLLA